MLFYLRGVVALALISGLLAAPPVRAQDTPKSAPAPILDGAAPKISRDGTMDSYFQRKHAEFLKRGKAGKIGVLFIGDSITDGWAGQGRPVWEKQYTQYDPANFGIGGDRTQHVIWRIENGELDGIAPRVVVLLIGTNNIGSPSEQIYRGDKKIIDEIHAKLPDAKLLVLGIFPRGADPSDPNVAYHRKTIREVNARLALLDDGNKTRFLDISDKFLSPDGTIPKEIMPDALHPNTKGYQIWADAMQPTLDSMLK